MRKIITAVVIIALVIVAGFGFYQWHCSEMTAVEESQNELMNHQFKAIQNKSVEEKRFLLEEKNSLIEENESLVSEMSTLLETKESLLAENNSMHSEMKSLNEMINNLLVKEEVVFNSDSIMQQIIDIAKPVIYEYHHCSSSFVETSKQFKHTGWKVPGSTKTSPAEIQGVVKVSVDMTKIKILTDETNKTITAIIPDAMIISNELFEETLVVHDEEEGIFTNITLADTSSMRIDVKAKAEKRARDYGLFEQTREETGNYVLDLIESVPSVKNTYQIILKYA